MVSGSTVRWPVISMAAIVSAPAARNDRKARERRRAQSARESPIEPALAHAAPCWPQGTPPKCLI